MDGEIIIALAIVAVGVGFAYWYLASSPAPKKPTTPGAAVEHAICDDYRLTLAEKRAELLATPSFDPLRRGNLEGEIKKNAALLAECERQANR